ncbi:MAG: cobyrinic acid a,c-diamide synthase, partial [Proteobacteria bacterium]|nr:cobyrinic acid a,c-diamide synthase [Pseudomonadota bacterium]
VDLRTHSTQNLIEFLQQFDLPLVTCIRNTQRYVQIIDNGMSLFDVSASDPADLAQWQPLLDWLVSRR